jgi:hypothetical protein
MSLDMKTTKNSDSTCVRGVGGLSAGGRGLGDGVLMRGVDRRSNSLYEPSLI